MIMNDFRVVVRIVGPLGGRKRGSPTRRLDGAVYYIGSLPFCHNTARSLFVEHIEVELTKLGTNRRGVPQDLGN